MKIEKTWLIDEPSTGVHGAMGMLGTDGVWSFMGWGFYACVMSHNVWSLYVI